MEWCKVTGKGVDKCDYRYTKLSKKNFGKN